ncbi:hypothetical protein ALTERO38_60409 [Alteromonas sp. 38]|nr:hypothetical protein ALTERO38_60409 [Alteromonas sp. 38]
MGLANPHARLPDSTAYSIFTLCSCSAAAIRRSISALISGSIASGACLFSMLYSSNNLSIYSDFPAHIIVLFQFDICIHKLLDDVNIGGRMQRWFCGGVTPTASQYHWNE